MKIISTLFLLFISLEFSGQAPEEVIVTARFTPRANSFKINNDSLAKGLPERKGRGLQVRSQAAAKLGSPVVIRLRCGAVYSGPDPIYVVDGTILPNINNIDNNDIEDITVLQSPQAQSIFGTQGMYGAIIIKLKMRYDKVIIKDLIDKEPVSKATVSFVFPQRIDTLRYIADDSGIVVQ